MSKAQYDIYRRKVLDLAKTLVVKSSASADAINTELRNIGHSINENDPQSWKYFLHLAGEYHSTDVQMTVKSLDTLEDIPFTKDSLEHHLATSREYRQYGNYYRALVVRFPEQEDLIKGILNPVDIDVAIDAEDGQILYYDHNLVESNEENLIPRLETWCKVYSRRWLVRAYTLVDNLYVPAHLANMYMLIPAVVMNIRLANCHTNYAHSYHIREYLASHQKLDWAVDYMTKKQMLWLYREIRFIERNAGKQTTFRTLIDNVLTERNLPLAEWSMRHLLSEMPDELTPRVEFARSTLNLDLSAAGIETRNVTEMLEAEAPMARGNLRVMDDEAPLIREQMETSIKDQLETKVLESAVIDTTDASIFTLSDTLLNHWLYLTQLDRYTAILTVDNPRTGAPLILSVKEAFVVFLYAMGHSMGLEMTNLPILPANNVRKLNTPSRATLEGMVQKDLVDKNVFDALYRDLPPVRNYISTEAFYRDVEGIHRNLMWHRWIWATREHKDERGMVEGAARHFYHNYTCDLGAETKFVDWFTARGLDMMLFTRLESQLLAETLVSHATGANLNVTTSLRDIQTAMLRIMSTLSSYSVQYLQSINDQPLLVTDWPMPRIGNIHATGGDHIEGVSINITAIGIREEGHIRDRLPAEGWERDPKFSAAGELTDRIEFNLNVQSHSVLEYHYRVEMPRIMALGEIYDDSELGDITIPDTDSYVPIDGLPLTDAFTSLQSRHYVLTPDELDELKQRWDNRPFVDFPYYGDGLKYPPYLPAEISVDLFIMPLRPIIGGEVVLDAIGYPSTQRVIYSDHLTYGNVTGEVVLDALGYQPVSGPIVIDDLPYPELKKDVVLDTLTYPGGYKGVVYSENLTYEMSIDFFSEHLSYVQPQDVELNALAYPALTGRVTIDDLDYPDAPDRSLSTAAPDKDLDGLVYSTLN